MVACLGAVSHLWKDGVVRMLEEEAETSTNIPMGDLPCSVIISDAERKLLEVCDNCVHQNGSTHLDDGGIKDSAVWQERWQKQVLVTALPPSQYIIMRKEEQSDASSCAC